MGFAAARELSDEEPMAAGGWRNLNRISEGRDKMLDKAKD
jgi:hypothetical protein